jgi:hypothetical protein
MFEYLGAVPNYRFNKQVEEVERPADNKIAIFKRNIRLKGCDKCSSTFSE